MCLFMCMCQHLPKRQKASNPAAVATRHARMDNIIVWRGGKAWKERTG